MDFIGKDYWEQNIRSLRKDGRLVLLGIMSGAEVPKLDLRAIHFRRLQILGTTLRSRDEKVRASSVDCVQRSTLTETWGSNQYQGELLSSFEREAMCQIRDGGMEVKLHEVLDWTEVQRAHEMMESNSNAGKIVLRIC